MHESAVRIARFAARLNDVWGVSQWMPRAWQRIVHATIGRGGFQQSYVAAVPAIAHSPVAAVTFAQNCVSM